MSEQPRFQPVLPAHAIERCAITVVFGEPLPTKLFAALKSEVEKGLQALRFKRSASPTVGFIINDAGGVVVQRDGADMPAVFAVDGGSPQLTLQPNSIVYVTSEYVRWRPFLGGFERAAAKVVAQYSEAVSVHAVKVDYWDRFLWTGTWDNFDAWKLLRHQEVPFVASRAAKFGAQWHSHCGWFENKTDGVRRLVNINIDALDVARPGGGTMPSIGIYTMMQDAQIMQDRPLLDLPLLSPKLDELHNNLKSVFGELVTDEIQEMVSLNPKEQS